MALKYYSSDYILHPPREGDAGYDLRALSSYVICSQEQKEISTGIYVEIPTGYVGIIKDRSSMARRRLYTHAGVIDSSYRGEIVVLVDNQSGNKEYIREGDKIAQLLIIPCLSVPTERVSDRDELTDTVRQDNGFGSTGR